MKRLILVRHAEAVERKGDRPDFDRPLLPEGEKRAQSMGKKMRKAGIKVDLLVSSPADRALETSHIFAQCLGYPIQRILLFEAIYKATDAMSLLQLVRDMDNRHADMLMVGHNPSLSELARHLVRDLRLDIPKAGAVRIDFSVPSWEEVGPESARLIGFDIPGAVAKAEKWHKKIRRELSARMVRLNMAILEEMDRTAAKEVAQLLKDSLKKTAFRFVKEARNFSLDDVSWLETFEKEPIRKAKPSPSRRGRAVKGPKSKPARRSQNQTGKQPRPESSAAPMDSGSDLAVPAASAEKTTKGE